MLRIFYGNMENVIFNTSVYFRNTYLDEWITDEFVTQMIADVDKSIVIAPHLIQSPMLGVISPKELSGGVKTLILIYKDKMNTFNASNCGDNCAKWLLKMSELGDVTINLRHMMDFGDGTFDIEIINTHQVVHNMKELMDAAGRFV